MFPEEARTLVVIDDISKMVSAAVVCLSHAHRIVRQVHIAVVACTGPLAIIDLFASRRPTEEWDLLAGAQDGGLANLYFGMVSLGAHVAARLEDSRY
jgi:hypothetical protein